MKILALHTGGTISCKEINGVLTPIADISTGFKYFENEYGVTVEHKFITPFLSEHLDGEKITEIAREVKNAVDSGDFSGIIVTHGSDTVSYTAASLGYALGSDCIPVVLVCSNLPLGEDGSTGFANLHGAFALIKEGKRGVFSVYFAIDYTPKAGENDYFVSVFRGTRLLRQGVYQSELTCVGKEFARVHILEADLFSALNGKQTEAVVSQSEQYSEGTDEVSPIDVNLAKSSPVTCISVFPSMIYPKISATCKAVILDTYHSGTLDTKSEETVRFARLCKRRNIPVFVSGIGANADYESMTAFDKLGFKRLPPLSSPAAMYIKLWLLLTSGRDISELYSSLGGDIFVK